MKIVCLIFFFVIQNVIHLLDIALFVCFFFCCGKRNCCWQHIKKGIRRNILCNFGSGISWSFKSYVN